MPPFTPTKTLSPHYDFTILPFRPIPINARAHVEPQAVEETKGGCNTSGYAGAVIFLVIIVVILFFSSCAVYGRSKRVEKDAAEYLRIKRATRHLPGGEDGPPAGSAEARSNLSPVSEGEEAVHPTFESKYNNKIRSSLGMSFTPTASGRAWSPGTYELDTVSLADSPSDVPETGPAPGGTGGRSLTAPRRS